MSLTEIVLNINDLIANAIGSSGVAADDGGKVWKGWMKSETQQKLQDELKALLSSREDKSPPLPYSQTQEKEEKNDKERKREKKSKKDPNAPKRPLSAYMFFCRAAHPALREKHPDKSFGELAKIMGAS